MNCRQPFYKRDIGEIEHAASLCRSWNGRVKLQDVLGRVEAEEEEDKVGWDRIG